MTSREIQKKYIEFFKKHGHKEIPQAPLVPENDPTVLFTTAGMHPLIPYLLGEKHPDGTRLVNIQRCIRTGDIDEVGDTTHNTFFEMLGNWSFGDYWKKEAIEWSWEFLTQELKIPQEKIAVTIFAGDESVPKDEESEKIWLKYLPKERVCALNKDDNFWGPAGAVGPCGPDTEMFIWAGEGDAPEKFDSKDTSWIEVWNDVFMEYFKNEKGEFEPLKQKNVDTGMGLERMAMVLQGKDNVYDTDLFQPIMNILKRFTFASELSLKDRRIISDHCRTITFLLMDGVEPSNKDQGYVLRRLIRKIALYEHKFRSQFYQFIMAEIIKYYNDNYPDLIEHERDIYIKYQNESAKFRSTIDKGMQMFNKTAGMGSMAMGTFAIGMESNKLTGKDLFDLYQTYGFPLELSLEIAKEKNVILSENAQKEFNQLVEKHREQSRTASAGKFKGGLADASEISKKYHTASHILLQVLRNKFGEQVIQRGSNITPERMRFDFAFDRKLTPEEVAEIEKKVNEIIQKDLTVTCAEMSKDEAKKSGAHGIFDSKYGERVKVYTIEQTPMEAFSKEICGGPHVTRTGELGKFKIIKEESSSAGVRRIKAVLV